MPPPFRKLIICLALMASAAFAQTKPSFEVATIKPAQPMDQAKILAALQSGGKMPVGATIDSHRAEYLYLDLKTLLTYAYGVKPYQITGPDWMATTRFDIVAKMPEGSTREDAPRMLQSLLEERFKLTTHRTTAEHPVLALVVGKGGPKLKASAETPVALDESAPLKPGEMKMDGPEGPVRAKVDMATGSSVVDMGLRGKMSYKMNPATQAMHIDFSMTTMAGFADMMTQLMAQLGGGAGGRQIVDMTGIKGNYDASLEISLAEIIAMARSAGADIPVGAGRGAAGPGNAPVASDPAGGGSSVTDAVQSMGLKLESRKAMVDQFIVDRVEKTPTEN
ncbi:MAG TPA: TIGR03435 family protein [Bryobacteraceae bacterium]|nr:TIGR03435 family protein [Bryobacteraceae bacterium]